jgi:predicted neuraminidase
VKIEASVLPRGARQWGPRFTLADTPGFPDTNPILFVDSRSRLWLIWPVILANRWETALLKYRITAPLKPGQVRGAAPRWEVSDNLLFKPHPNFEARVKAAAEPMLAGAPPALAREIRSAMAMAGDKFAARLGWMPRIRPIELPSGRILVPLYSDGFNFSLIAITDDGGRTWSTGEPIVGAGAVQPALVRRRDGSIVAYLRDNGPPPQRVMVSESRDEGVSWSAVVDSDIPNPGSSVDVISLRDGGWLMVFNDTEKGRHSLALALSEDEGKTWPWKRHLELDSRAQGAGSFHYPSSLQTRDGRIHVSYSYFLNHLPRDAARKSIKHASFTREWIRPAE